jgi:excisionase family DNA binding protein
MTEKKVFSTTELAKILGISRIAVYKRIKKGQIKAVKYGRDFVIERKDMGDILQKELTEAQKKEIDQAVRKTVKEYGETLKLLGRT